MSKPVSSELSAKRAAAGRKGAAARWGTRSGGQAPEVKPFWMHSARQISALRQGRNDWYRIQNQSDDTTKVYIYDEIGYFGVTANDFVRDLQAIETSTIELHLNTPGGNVFDGIAIYNALVQHDASVEVMIDGLAASAGSFIAQAGDNIQIARNATMMIHDAAGIVIGNAKDMREMADLLDKMSDNIASIYAERAGGDTEDWREAMRDESWYNADEAVEAGLADEVIGKSDDSGASNNWDLSIFTYAGREQAPDPSVTPETKHENKQEDPEPDFDPAEFQRIMQEAFQ